MWLHPATLHGDWFLVVMIDSVRQVIYSTWLMRSPLPVKFAVQGQYMPVNPDVFGQKWNLQFGIAPVIPKLIRGNILEDW